MSKALVVPTHAPAGSVQLDVVQLLQVPAGWVVFHYCRSPKPMYHGKAFPHFWKGPGTNTWIGSMGSSLPEEAKVFATSEEARAAMTAEQIPIRAEDDVEQGSLF